MTQTNTTKDVADLLLQEAEAIRQLTGNPSLMRNIRDAAQAIADNSAPLIVAGIGKSGHIARKIASTMCSLGRTATFLHAAEASHGDLGVLHPKSILLILSNSGETSELSDLLAYAQEHSHVVVGLTANADSTLGRVSQYPLAYGKQTEICRNGLAPTTSTTVSLAIGDALAVCVSNLMNMQPEDFRRYHPGGKLGARLAKVGDVMKTNDQLAFARKEDAMAQAVITMSEKNLGVLLVKNEAGEINGIITDGDMRRATGNLLNQTVHDISSGPPLSVGPEMSLDDALSFMTENKVTSCAVRDHDGKGGFLGLVHIHDCIKG
jgi:arabinose-5-phosphate isomerase